MRKTFTYQGKRYFVRGDTLEEVIEKKALKLQELKENEDENSRNHSGIQSVS